MRSQKIIIMARSNHKIKPIQLKSWMLYLYWASKRVRRQHTWCMPSFITYKDNPCSWAMEKGISLKHTIKRNRQFTSNLKRNKITYSLQVSHYKFVPATGIYEQCFWSQFLKSKQHPISFAITIFKENGVNCQLTTKGNKIWPVMGEK